MIEERIRFHQASLEHLLQASAEIKQFQTTLEKQSLERAVEGRRIPHVQSNFPHSPLKLSYLCPLIPRPRKLLLSLLNSLSNWELMKYDSLRKGSWHHLCVVTLHCPCAAPKEHSTCAQGHLVRQPCAPQLSHQLYRIPFHSQSLDCTFTSNGLSSQKLLKDVLFQGDRKDVQDIIVDPEARTLNVGGEIVRPPLIFVLPLLASL